MWTYNSLAYIEAARLVFGPQNQLPLQATVKEFQTPVFGQTFFSRDLHSEKEKK